MCNKIQINGIIIHFFALSLVDMDLTRFPKLSQFLTTCKNLPIYLQRPRHYANTVELNLTNFMQIQYFSQHFKTNLHLLYSKPFRTRSKH